jgi:hypothetical protein
MSTMTSRILCMLALCFTVYPGTCAFSQPTVKEPARPTSPRIPDAKFKSVPEWCVDVRPSTAPDYTAPGETVWQNQSRHMCLPVTAGQTISKIWCHLHDDYAADPAGAHCNNNIGNENACSVGYAWPTVFNVQPSTTAGAPDLYCVTIYNQSHDRPRYMALEGWR